MTKRLRRLYDVTLCAWLLSWFALYLEIFRYRHVIPSRMLSVLWPVADAAAKPGGFVRTVVACSVLAPLVFLALSIAGCSNERSASICGVLILRCFAGALALLGLTMLLLGGLNQMIRKPPMAFDLSMRQGNGGFLVLGVALFAAATFFRYRTTSETEERTE